MPTQRKAFINYIKMDKMIDYCKKLELYINTDYYKNQIAIGAFSTRFAKFIKENDLSLPQPINPHDEEIEETKTLPSDEYIEKWFQKKYPAAENWTLIANNFTWGDIVTDYKDLLQRNKSKTTKNVSSMGNFLRSL